MNKERLEELAAKIESLPHEQDYGDYAEPLTAFNMNAWRCGSVACIGGWAQHMWLPNATDNAVLDGVIAELLDIPVTQAARLFFPVVDNYREITPAQAATVIRNLIFTGEVDWSVKDTVEGIDL